MKRSRNSQPTLKHLAFFEVLAGCGEDSAVGRSTTAGLLSLRLIDHWILAGAQMVQPESVSVRSVRNAIMAMPAHEPLREVLLGIVNTMQTLREVDMQPVLPRLAAYASLLERRSDYKLAADVYETVIRLGEEEFDGDVVVDAYLRLGFCYRTLSVFDASERAFVEGGRIAKRRKEVARELRSRIGLANVTMFRGNLPRAEEMFSEICSLTNIAENEAELAQALHGRANVAIRRGAVKGATCLAYDALQLTKSAIDRERILADISAMLILEERYDAAYDALLIIDATAISESVRIGAKVNLTALAARKGDRVLFERARAEVPSHDLLPELEVNFLIESARGLHVFGEVEESRATLLRARDFALAHGLNRALFEAEQMMAGVVEERSQNSGRSEDFETSTAHVEQGLRELASALAN
jgi:tetratricopeptide (TPR) repeat protein